MNQALKLSNSMNSEIEIIDKIIHNAMHSNRPIEWPTATRQRQPAYSTC